MIARLLVAMSLFVLPIALLSAVDIESLTGKYFCDAGFFDIASDSITTYFGDSETIPRRITEKATYTLESGFVRFTTKSFLGYLIQAPDILIFLFQNQKSGFIGWETGMKIVPKGSTVPMLWPARVDRVSSALMETIGGNSTRYHPGDQLTFNTVQWVPTTPSGSEIEMTVPSENDLGVKDIDGIYVMNGFFDFRRPDLFLKNARIKQMELSVNGQRTVVDFPDDMSLKYVKFLGKVPGSVRNIVKMKVIDVYPGSKYKDVAISAAMWLSQRP